MLPWWFFALLASVGGALAYVVVDSFRPVSDEESDRQAREDEHWYR